MEMPLKLSAQSEIETSERGVSELARGLVDVVDVLFQNQDDCQRDLA